MSRSTTTRCASAVAALAAAAAALAAAAPAAIQSYGRPANVRAAAAPQSVIRVVRFEEPGARHGVRFVVRAPAAPSGLVRVLRIEAPAAPSGPSVIASHGGSAFDWRDTGIAAGAGVAALALGATLIVTRRRRPAVPEVPVLD